VTDQPPHRPRLIAVRVHRAEAGPAVRRIWSDGDAVLLLDPDAPVAHRTTLLRALRPDALVDLVEGDGRTRPLADPLPTAAGTAVVVATSGSTGAPKGVVLTHDALAASTRASLARLGAAPGDRWALTLPTHHVAGLQVWLRAWATGTDPLDVDDLRALPGSGAAFVSLVPTQLARWLDELTGTGPPPGTAPTVLLGGAAASTELLARAADAGLRVVTSYGMSETGGGCVYDGWPLDDVEVRLDDTGRVGLRGAVLATGYRGDDAPLTDTTGWFWTSDLGRRDPEGRLHVLGRADDVVVSGGENVPLALVRAALATHPAVADVAVIGRPDADWGQAVVALVVPAAGTAPTLEDLRAHVRADHPAAYAPRRLRLVPALPRDAMGKLPRARLEALADDGPDASPRRGRPSDAGPP
jgi:o-succinylbenzoate---CoA ligase